MADATFGLSPEKIAAAHALGVDALIRIRDTGSPHVPSPDVEALRTILFVGHLAAPTSTPTSNCSTKELGIDGDLRASRLGCRHRRPRSHLPGRDRRRRHVGDRRRAPAPARPASTYVIFEKNADVGGTWLENTYPGLPGRRPEPLLQLLVRPARRLAVLLLAAAGAAPTTSARASTSSASATDIRFGTEVTSIVVDDDDGHAGRSSRRPRRHRGDASWPTRSISAVGQLNRPQLPDIDGRDSFAGPSFHSARWDHAVDLDRQAGRRDRHGCSAAQFIPTDRRAGRRT